MVSAAATKLVVMEIVLNRRLGVFKTHKKITKNNGYNDAGNKQTENVTSIQLLDRHFAAVCLRRIFQPGNGRPHRHGQGHTR